MIELFYWYSKKDLWKAFVGSFFVVLFWVILNAFSLQIQWAYEKYSSVDSWVVYNSTVPLKPWYKKNEELKFISNISRYKDARVQRQDTVYCNYWDFERKLKTQYRPEIGNEYVMRWEMIDMRTYNLPIPNNVFSCKICRTVVTTTPLWYEKVLRLCTDNFLVNQ